MECVHTTSIHLRNRAWPISPKAPAPSSGYCPPRPGQPPSWPDRWIAFAAFYTVHALESSNRCCFESGFFGWIFYLWDPSMSFLKRISFLKNSFIYFGPCWVLVALRAFLSLIVAGGGSSLVAVCWLIPVASLITAHRLSRTCGLQELWHVGSVVAASRLWSTGSLVVA